MHHKQEVHWITGKRLVSEFSICCNSLLDTEGRKSEKMNMLKTQKEFWLMKVYLC